MRMLKQFLSLALVMSVVHAGSAFSLLGPAKAWQVRAIGYQLFGFDIGTGPMGLSEAYRWNVPTVKLNLDPATLQPSSFVNEVRYSYQIIDPIRDPAGDYASAIEVPLKDPRHELDVYSSVAGGLGSFDIELGPTTLGGQLTSVAS